MPPVSMSSPENSRPLGLLFSNNPNYGCPYFQEFPENSIFETYKCYDPFCIGKNRLRLSIFWMFWPILYGKKLILRFSIFWMNQKILSIFQKILSFFWKNSFLKIFTSVLTHFVWGKNIEFQIFNFLDES